MRSVCLARMLAKRGHEVLTAGVKENKEDTILMLAEWADKICLQADAAARFYEILADDPTSLIAKADLRFNVGVDDWKEPHHPDLVWRMRELVEKYPL